MGGRAAMAFAPASIDKVRCSDRLSEKAHRLMALLRPIASRFMVQKRLEIREMIFSSETGENRSSRFFLVRMIIVVLKSISIYIIHM